MGFGGISPWSLLLILAIVILLFGTKKLRNLGGDLGSAIKNFRKGMREGDAEAAEERKQLEAEAEGKVIDAEARTEHKDKV